MPIQSKQQPPYYNKTTAFKIYKALLTQTSTNAPIENIFIDDIGPTMTYDNVGRYKLTKTDAFPENKTWINIGNNSNDLTVLIVANRQNDNEVLIEVSEASSYANNWLFNTPIEIIIKP